MKNCLEPGLPLPWHLLSENGTDTSSGVLSGQSGEGWGSRSLRGGSVPSSEAQTTTSFHHQRKPGPAACGVSVQPSVPPMKMTPEVAETASCKTGCRKSTSAPLGSQSIEMDLCLSPSFLHNYVFKLNLRHRGGGVGGLAIGKMRRLS